MSAVSFTVQQETLLNLTQFLHHRTYQQYQHTEQCSAKKNNKAYLYQEVKDYVRMLHGACQGYIVSPLCMSHISFVWYELILISPTLQSHIPSILFITPSSSLTVQLPQPYHINHILSKSSVNAGINSAVLCVLICGTQGCWWGICWCLCPH